MKYKKSIINTLCVIVISAILITTIWDFSTQLQHALTKETYRTLSDVSIDYNKAFLDRISYNIKTMGVLAGGLREMKNLTKQEIMRVLQNAVDDGGFTRMVVCTTDGISCSNDGISRDISELDYFKRAILGETDLSKPLISVVNGERNIVLAMPINGEFEMIGILFGLYPLSTAGAQLLDFTYYSEGYGFVISPDGTILLSSEHTDKLANEENLFSFFEKTHFIDFSIDEINRAIKNGESESFTFTYDGERRFVSFTPSTINDWYTFSISSDFLMKQQEKVTHQIVFRLVIKLIVAGGLLIAWIWFEIRQHNKELMVASKKYQSLLDNINGGMVVATNAQKMSDIIATYVSSGFTEMTGYSIEDIQNIYNGRYLDLIIDEDRKEAFEKHFEQISHGSTYRVSYRIRKKDCSVIWVMDNGYLITDMDGLHNHSILTDITLIKQQEEELRMSENRFSIAINASSGTLFEVDLKKQMYTHFENAERIFGISDEKLLKDTRKFSTMPHDEFINEITNYFFHPDDLDIAKKAMIELPEKRTTSYEARLRRFDNSYIWARIDLSLSLDEVGAPARLVGFMSDIDDIKKQAEFLESKVQSDPMTGLYNKVAMANLSNKIISNCKNELHALIVLDIDNFKGINDTLGHAFGDVVLIEVCTKLKTLFRSDDIVGRMGGDEFAILMKNVSDINSVLKKATALSGDLRQTYIGEKENYKISCSMGIIIIGTCVESFETLYRKVDAALYKAKQNGKDQFVLYQEEDAENYPIEYTRTNDEEHHNFQTSHNIEAQILELLYTSKDFNVSINIALAAIGQQYHVSRVSIFENDAENQTTSNIYEWCNEGIRSEIDNIQKMKLSSGEESVLDCFDSNGLLYCNDVRELPPYPRRLLESQGVMSTLKVTIVNDEKLYGFIGFDECSEHRVWRAEEIEKLSFMAKVLSIFLFKKKTEIALLENLHTRLQILDVLPDYICVVNPETHTLEYTNKKMQELLPEARSGAFCFTMLRGGQNAPCESCLVERIKRGDTNNLEIISKDQKVHLKINALTINWTKNQKMVLLYSTEAAVDVL